MIHTFLQWQKEKYIETDSFTGPLLRSVHRRIKRLYNHQGYMLDSFPQGRKEERGKNNRLHENNMCYTH